MTNNLPEGTVITDETMHLVEQAARELNEDVELTGAPFVFEANSLTTEINMYVVKDGNRTRFGTISFPIPGDEKYYTWLVGTDPHVEQPDLLTSATVLAMLYIITGL